MGKLKEAFTGNCCECPKAIEFIERESLDAFADGAPLEGCLLGFHHHLHQVVYYPKNGITADEYQVSCNALEHYCEWQMENQNFFLFRDTPIDIRQKGINAVYDATKQAYWANYKRQDHD